MATSDSGRRRRLFWWWFGSVSFVIIVALLFVRFFLFNDKSTPLTTDEALERYRTSTIVVRTTVPAEAQTLPATGVYRYATVGRESIDALGGAEHVYPSETTITYTPAGCGVQMLWAPLVERNDEWNLCVTDAGIELQRKGGAYHMFFGTAEVEPLMCDRTVVLIPADDSTDPSIGQPVQLTCRIGDKDWYPVWQVLERDTRTVAGVELEVQHLRMTVVDEDEYPEQITLDWYLDEHGLLIEAALAKETLAESVLGGVTYLESYTLKLISLTPLQ